MKKNERILIGLIALGLLIGIVLMFTNEKLFNEITGAGNITASPAK